MPKQLKKGDRVEWGTSQGKTHGRVEKKVTSKTQVGGHTARASEDDPQYVVKSEKTGKRAVHKPGALERG